jgi:hypothetical protein
MVPVSQYGLILSSEDIELPFREKPVIALVDRSNGVPADEPGDRWYIGRD